MTNQRKNPSKTPKAAVLALVIMLTALLLPGTAKAASVMICQGGNCNVEIIKPDPATAFEEQAAKDLKEYLEKLTNATIVIKDETEDPEKIPIYILIRADSEC